MCPSGRASCCRTPCGSQDVRLLYGTVHSSCDAAALDAVLTATIDVLDKAIQALNVVMGSTDPFRFGSEKFNYMRNLHHTFGTGYYRGGDTALSADDVRIARDRRGEQPEDIHMSVSGSVLTMDNKQ
jgi:hypothetical protein